jgi:hypothetical protein
MTMTTSNDDHDDHDDLQHDSSPTDAVSPPDPEEQPFIYSKASEKARLLAARIQALPINALMENWRTCLDAKRLKQASGSFDVPQDFLREFGPGWIPELGAVALPIDATGELQGVEIRGLMPQDAILDRNTIVGHYGHPSPTKSVHPKAPLMVGTNFAELYEHWHEKRNVMWRCCDVMCPKALPAIERHADRIGAPEVVHLADADRTEEMRRWVQAARASILDRYG